MKVKNMVIALSGFHGSGKTSLGIEIAKKYSLRHVSSGMVFRSIAREMGVSLNELSLMAEKSPEIDYKIDERLRRIAKKGGIVADALLSGWVLKDIAHIKIWLKAPLEVRIKRIASREERPYEEVYKETIIREGSEIKRFKKYYNIDLNDLSIYDFVISTYPYTFESVKRILFQIIDSWIESREE